MKAFEERQKYLHENPESDFSITEFATFDQRRTRQSQYDAPKSDVRSLEKTKPASRRRRALKVETALIDGGLFL